MIAPYYIIPECVIERTVATRAPAVLAGRVKPDKDGTERLAVAPVDVRATSGTTLAAATAAATFEHLAWYNVGFERLEDLNANNKVWPTYDIIEL